MPTARTPDAATVRRYAVMADVDPRTILKELRGARTRGMAGRRARAVLVREGLLPAVALGTPGPKGNEA